MVSKRSLRFLLFHSHYRNFGEAFFEGGGFQLARHSSHHIFGDDSFAFLISFQADFDGHVEDTKVSKAIKALQERCEEVTVLGSYPVAEVSG